MASARIARTGLACLIGAVTIGAAGCGGSSGTITAVGSPGGTRHAGEVPTAHGGGRMSVMSLRKAAANATASTGRFEMTMEVSEPASGSKMSMSMQGASTGDRTQVSTSTTFTGGMADELASAGMGGLMNMEMISIGADAYVKGGMFAMMFGGSQAGADAWVKLPATGVTEMDQSSPEGLTKLLDGAYGEVTDLGPQDVRGVATTHYRVMFDAKALGGLAGSPLPARGLDQLDGLPMDLFVDADSNLRRMTFTAEAEGASMSMSMDLFDFEATDIVIEPPADFTEVDPNEMLGGFGAAMEDMFGEVGGEI